MFLKCYLRYICFRAILLFLLYYMMKSVIMLRIKLSVVFHPKISHKILLLQDLAIVFLH